MATANDTQVAGTHYKTEYQHWDLVWDTGMGYFPGQITKYLFRHSKKNGLQDVQKALHFATKYAELLADSGATIAPNLTVAGVEKLLRRFLLSNPHLSDAELQVLRLCTHTHNAASMASVRSLIEDVAGAYPTPGYVNQGD